MDVLRAKTAGFCMGVSLALQKLDSALNEHSQGTASPGRICTLGPIIHNPQVLADCAARGVVCLTDAAKACTNDCVLIRAHGIPQHEEALLRASGAHVADATCPKVKKAQLAIARATAGNGTFALDDTAIANDTNTTAPSPVADALPLLLFGEADHPEVRGLVSYAAGPAHVFGSLEEFRQLPLAHFTSCVLASQTTQDKDGFAVIEAELRHHIPDCTVLSTICDATRKRQEEARRIASAVDIMVIVGGRQSGNTRRLADVAGASGIATFLVESADELRPEDFTQITRVGLTAGASTPKSLIDDAEQYLSSM